MDPITAAAVAGLTAVAVDAAREGATHIAKSAWGKLKGVLGWKDEPAPGEIEARAEKTLTERPELAAQVQQVVNDYHQQVAGVSVGSIGSMDLAGAQVGTVKQINVVNNQGGIQA